MIQRIQSIYILLSVALMAAVVFLSPISFTGTAGIFDLTYMGVANSAGKIVFNTMPITIYAMLTLVMVFVSLFLFKNRMLQLRLNVLSAVLMIGYYPLMFYFQNAINKELGTDTVYNYPVVFPIVAAILTFLAVRAIGKDIALLRSLDRIR